MSKIHSTVYVMAQDAPHLERQNIEHTKLRPALKAGSYTTYEDTPRTLHTLLNEDAARVAIEATQAVTGTGWKCAPVEERVTRYVRIDREAAQITRAPERVEVPEGYTLLCRDKDGIKQYALVHSHILYTSSEEAIEHYKNKAPSTDNDNNTRTKKTTRVI